MSSMPKQITFPELQEKFTLDILKQCVGLAEGFEIIECENNYYSISVNGSEYGNIITDEIIFPLLLHRAVEGWNKVHNEPRLVILSDVLLSDLHGVLTHYEFKDYRPCHLTACEMAIWHCLCEVLG